MVSGPGRRDPRAHLMDMWTGQMQRLRGFLQPVGMRWDSGQVKAPSLLPAVREAGKAERPYSTLPQAYSVGSVCCVSGGFGVGPFMTFPSEEPSPPPGDFIHGLCRCMECHRFPFPAQVPVLSTLCSSQWSPVSHR